MTTEARDTQPGELPSARVTRIIDMRIPLPYLSGFGGFSSPTCLRATDDHRTR